MATRATISRVTDEGYIRYIYSHWDGYLKGVGATLLENYNTDAQVAELIENGDVSELAPTIKDSVFYHRDRGELLNAVCPLETDTVSDLKNDYNYVWTGSEWLVGYEGGWYRLAYLLQARIPSIDANDYVFGRLEA